MHHQMYTNQCLSFILNPYVNELDTRWENDVKCSSMGIVLNVFVVLFWVCFEMVDIILLTYKGKHPSKQMFILMIVVKCVISGIPT